MVKKKVKLSKLVNNNNPHHNTITQNIIKIKIINNKIINYQKNIYSNKKIKSKTQTTLITTIIPIIILQIIETHSEINLINNYKINRSIHQLIFILNSNKKNLPINNLINNHQLHYLNQAQKKVLLSSDPKNPFIKD